MEDKEINRLGYFIWANLCAHGCMMEYGSQKIIEETIKQHFENGK